VTVGEIAHRLHGRKVGAGWIVRCPAHAGCDQRAVLAALRALGLWSAREPRQVHNIVATYDYRDEAGELLYQVVRTDPKGFFQRRPDGDGTTSSLSSARGT